MSSKQTLNYRPILDAELKNLAYNYKDLEYSFAQTFFLLMRATKGPEFSKTDMLCITDEELLNAVATLKKEFEKERIIRRIETIEGLYDDDTTPEDLKEKIFLDIEELEAQLTNIEK
jgi:hypothetical protein